MSAEIDFYELLEVTRDADDGTLKSAYRKLAMKYHPDKNPGCAESEAKFKAVSHAYDILKDPQKRAAYDRFGHAAFANGAGGGAGAGGFEGGAGFSDIGDIFESIFGSAFGGGSGRQQSRRGADLRYDLEISLEDAFHGREVAIEVDVAATCDPCAGSGAEPGTGRRRCNMCGGHGVVRTQQGFFMMERTCPTCHGKGEVIENPCKACRGEGRVEKRQKLDVSIPRGVDNGTRIRLSGKGEAGPNGSPPGDLYIFIHLKRHPLFDREGTTLHTRLPISFTTAALGGEIALPGLDGTKHLVTIRPGCQTGRQVPIRGAGMPALNGRGVGDLLVEIQVKTPEKLSAQQKELLRQFQATETGDECPEIKGFFDRVKGLWEDLTK